MSFCVNCGKELKEEEKFCPDCGTENGTEEAKETIITNPAPTYKVAKCFTVFGKIGPILGLISFIIAFIPFVWLAHFLLWSLKIYIIRHFH